jgi:nucleoid DNA-binding protein
LKSEDQMSHFRDETELGTTRRYDPQRLILILMKTELEGHRNLTHEQARTIVNEIFAAIREALQNGEVVRLPFGSLGVYEQDRQPTRGWFLNRVRVLYKRSNVIKFLGEEYDLEPVDQPPHTLDSKGEMKPSERNSRSRKISERRKLAALGVDAGKSRRLIAQELDVTETTIRRDLKIQNIRKKKPTATRRKPAVAFQGSSRGKLRAVALSIRFVSVSIPNLSSQCLIVIAWGVELLPVLPCDLRDRRLPLAR